MQEKQALTLLKVLAVTATQKQPMQTVRLLAGKKRLQAVSIDGGNCDGKCGLGSKSQNDS